MTSRINLERQELRDAAESNGVRYTHIDHFSYPPGKRLAVNLTVDFDAMLRRRLSNEPPMQLAKGEFGGRVGIWRLLELFKAHDVKATIFTPGRICELYPKALAAAVQAGHEIADHMWEHQVPADLDVEYDHLVKSTEALERFTGRRPVGTRSGHTRAFLKQLGYLYTSSGAADHVPYYVADNNRENDLLNLPFHYAIDDAMFFNFGWVESGPDGQRLADPLAAPSGRPCWSSIGRHSTQPAQPCASNPVSGRITPAASASGIPPGCDDKRLPGNHWICTMKIYHLPDTPKSLVFDIDLTLYDSRAYHASQRKLLIERLAAYLEASVQETEAKLRTIRDDFARHNAGRQLSMGNTFRYLGVGISTNIQWREELFMPEDHLRPDRDLDCALAKLSANFRIAAVTNNPTSIGERTLIALGVRRHFMPVLGLDRFHESKPTLVPFQMVSAQHGVPLNEMISIGDRIAVDIELPVEHGMGGILVEGVSDVYRLTEVLPCRLNQGLKRPRIPVCLEDARPSRASRG